MRNNILCDFGIQTDHLIRVRRPEPIIINKTKQKLLKWNMKVTVIPIVIGSPGPITKILIKTLEELERSSIDAVNVKMECFGSP